MIVIYTQNGTYIRTLESSKDLILSLYGDKLGSDTIDKLDNAPVGFKIQHHCGPLIQVITKEEADIITQKEQSIGMLIEL